MLKYLKNIFFKEKKIVKEFEFDPEIIFVKLLKKLIEQHNLKYEYSRSSIPKNIFSIENLNQLYHILFKLCELNNLTYKKNQILDTNLITFHYGFTENETLTPDTCVHVDNECLTDENVITLIVYNDDYHKGGEFAIYENKIKNNKTNDKIFKQNENEFEIVKKIDTWIGKNRYKGILFTGNVIHNCLPLMSGKRFAISIQIVSK